jgi:hypothetical protein
MTDTEKAECEGVIRLLTAKLEEAVGEIDRLRAVVAKLTEGADDAHSTLRRLYLDESQPSNTRLRAASAALNFERPRLESAPAIDVTPEPVEDLATLVHRRRARQNALQGLPPGDPRYLEWRERDGNDSDSNRGNGSSD